MNTKEQQTKPDGGASVSTDGLCGARSGTGYMQATIAKAFNDGFSQGKCAAITRCIEIVETYRVSVGNSASGELAAEWTMENLREIRDEMRALIEPDLTHNV